jgi:tRNA modification GTPase
MLGDWTDQEGVIDEVIVLPMQKGKSFTGQEMFELTCHGNPVLVRDILESLFALGARMAEAGEFTARAVLSGRIDLFDAERVQALIEAKTRYHAALIQRQESGVVIPYLGQQVHEVLSIQAHIEASIDYGEEDIEALDREQLMARIESVVSSMDRVLKASVLPLKMTSGFQVLLTGETNAGKSSLFNALCDHQRAIVTEIPGTTRDLVHEEVEIEGVPVILIDSAGVRKTHDPIEKIGMERIAEILPQMDLVLALFPADREKREYSHIAAVDEAKVMRVLSKSDLGDDPGKEIQAVSVYDEKSVQRLKKQIVQRLVGEKGFSMDQHYLITNRQVDVFEKARQELKMAVETLREGYGEEVCTSHLNSFRYKIGELTGETTVEDILDHMFSDFCLGK